MKKPDCVVLIYCSMNLQLFLNGCNMQLLSRTHPSTNTQLHLSIPPSLNPLNSILSWFCLFFSPCHLNSFSHTYGLRRQHDMSGGFRRIPVLLSRDKVSALTLISSTRSFLSLLSKQSICAFCRPDSFPTPLCLWLRLFLLTPDVVQTFIHVGWGLLTLVFMTRLLQKGGS